MLLPNPDPLAKTEFGGGEDELEVIYRYEKSQRELRKGTGEAESTEAEATEAEGEPGGRKGRRKKPSAAAKAKACQHTYAGWAMPAPVVKP